MSKDLILNNTLKISQSHNKNGYSSDKNNLLYKNSLASIYIIDRYDGHFKKLYIDNNDLFIIPESYINEKLDDNCINEPIKFLKNDELQNNIENISKNDINNDPLIFKYIYVNEIINFLPSNLSNINNDEMVGIRENNGIIEFKNNNEKWKKLDCVNKLTTLNNIDDININNLKDKYYLRYDTKNKYEFTELNIYDDNNPILGGNLNINNKYIKFDNNSNGIVDNMNNSLLKFNDYNTTSNNYVLIQHANNNNIKCPEITTNGNSKNIDLNLSTKGDGDININSNDLNINSRNINLNNLKNINLNSGFIQKSINTYNEYMISIDYLNPTIINATDNIILFNINESNKTYFVNLLDGYGGQKLEIIYESTTLNNILYIYFTRINDDNNIVFDKIILNKPGQTLSLIYLSNLNKRNRWHISYINNN